MARRRKRRSKSEQVSAASRLPSNRHPIRVMPAVVENNKKKPSLVDLRPVEDLRRVPRDVDKRETFKTRGGSPARIERRPEAQVSKSVLSTPVHDYFSDPRRVLVCIRRDARKRSLFALRRIGKGKKVSSIREYTDKSYVRCKE